MSDYDELAAIGDRLQAEDDLHDGGGCDPADCPVCAWVPEPEEEECESWHDQVPADSHCAICLWAPRDVKRAELARATVAELDWSRRWKELET